MIQFGLIDNILSRWFGFQNAHIQHVPWRDRLVTVATDSDELKSLISRLRPVEEPSKPLLRLGPPSDGGYLVPDDLADLVACFSGGVGPQSGFEADLANRGIAVFLTDATVAGPAVQHERFTFERLNLGIEDTADEQTIDHWLAKYQPKGDILLQLDIEGHEWSTLIQASGESLLRCRILVIEFHNLELLFSKQFFNSIGRPVIQRLLRTHRVAHLHPNNCAGQLTIDGITLPTALEVTFLRRDRYVTPRPVTELPHPLDHPNADGDDIILAPIWLEGSPEVGNLH